MHPGQGTCAAHTAAPPEASRSEPCREASAPGTSAEGTAVAPDPQQLHSSPSPSKVTAAATKVPTHQCREQPQRQLVPLSCGCPDAGGPVSKQPSCPARSRALWSCQSAGSMATAAPAAGKHLGQQAALCLPAVTCGLPAKTQRLRGCRVRHMDREGSERDAAQ